MFFEEIENSTEITIKSSLFNPEIELYKVILMLTTKSNVAELNSTFTDDLILLTNSKPYNGTCELDTYSGYALDTVFTVTCTDWVDDDGFVANYEFFSITHSNHLSFLDIS